MSGRGGVSSGPCGLHGPGAKKVVSLALQGGGAHGAFTWGVLDRLIEDGRLAFEAITGASAGAMNAVVMTDGWLKGGPEGARKQLETFWRRVSLDGGLLPGQRQVVNMLFEVWSPVTSNPVSAFWRNSLGPTLKNPLDINPLRDVLTDLVDFERLRSATVKLFVSATNVRSGKIKLFATGELDAAHVLASACLPTIFRAVEIDGEAYWDGGYMGNPALYPIFYNAASDDLILVQINPIHRDEVPTRMAEIQSRLSEITFNASLLRELRAVDFVTRLVDQGRLPRDEYKRALMHRIDGGEPIARFMAASRLRAEWNFFQELRDIGRAAAGAWLEAHYDDLGERSTLDLQAAYA